MSHPFWHSPAFGLSLLLFLIPFMLSAQNGWKQDSVIFVGSVADFPNSNLAKTVSFTFQEVVKRTPQTVFVTEVDASGYFSITIPCYYAQDFVVRYQERGTPLLCAPSDRLMLRINVDGRAEVIEGNRVKDNEDFGLFLKGLNQLDNVSVYDRAKELSGTDFSQCLANRETVYRLFAVDFQKQHQTSVWFNRFIDDYLTYATWQALLSYPEWHAKQNSLKREDVVLSQDYYGFLKRYDMDATDPISSMHAAFLYQLNRHVLRTPVDSLVKANRLFKEQGVIPGAVVLQHMILAQTTGFTRTLCLTKLYLDALDGKQWEAFEALYDSTLVTDPFFRKVINDGYVDLQRFLSNQVTDGANLRSIKSPVLKGLVDTLTTRFAGKVIYVDFWAPWCSPCMAELPYSVALQEAYQGKDVVFLFLGNRCEEGSWKATIANKGLTGEHLLLSDDQYQVLAGEFGITGIPHYVLIDKQGIIVSKSAPRPSHKDLITAELNRLLK